MTIRAERVRCEVCGEDRMCSIYHVCFACERELSRGRRRTSAELLRRILGRR